MFHGLTSEILPVLHSSFLKRNILVSIQTQGKSLNKKDTEKNTKNAEIYIERKVQKTQTGVLKAAQLKDKRDRALYPERRATSHQRRRLCFFSFC